MATHQYSNPDHHRSVTVPAPSNEEIEARLRDLLTPGTFANLKTFMQQVKSCGLILFRQTAQRRAFLLMKHQERYDLPKGHIEPGESELECALREMNEETGIATTAVQIVPDFEYRSVYYPQYARFNNEVVEKTLVIFLGWVDWHTSIATTEHLGYEWLDWQPPHQIQAMTIDPLLAEVRKYFAERQLDPIEMSVVKQPKHKAMNGDGEDF